jgi:hypothetical protein
MRRAGVTLAELVDRFTAEELHHAAEAAWLAERRAAEERVVRLAELLWDRPALGVYRRTHRPPPYPAGAPPLPPRQGA